MRWLLLVGLAALVQAHDPATPIALLMIFALAIVLYGLFRITPRGPRGPFSNCPTPAARPDLTQVAPIGQSV